MLYLIRVYTVCHSFSSLRSKMEYYNDRKYWERQAANSVNPDQILQNMASDLDLHCVTHPALFRLKSSKMEYQIRPNYRTYTYKHSVKQFRSLQITASQCTFCLFLYKRICCGYPFELHRQVDAIQMGTHNICLYKEKKKHKHTA